MRNFFRRGDVLAFILVAVAMAACLLLGGCGAAPRVAEKPNQGEALSTVWVWQYGMVLGNAPSVYWVEGSKLNCSDGRGWEVELGGVQTCVGGLTFHQSNQVLVAWPPGTTRFSDTALAHELCHTWSYDVSGDGDPGHVGPCFTAGGYVDQANAALRAEGL